MAFSVVVQPLMKKYYSFGVRTQHCGTSILIVLGSDILLPFPLVTNWSAQYHRVADETQLGEANWRGKNILLFHLKWWLGGGWVEGGRCDGDNFE